MLSDLAPWLTFNGSNFPYLEQIVMVLKMLEESRFDCRYKAKGVIRLLGFALLTLSDLQTNTFSANSVDPDETPNDSSFHQQDLHWMSFCIDVLQETPIWNTGPDQIQRWQNLLQKTRDERADLGPRVHKSHVGHLFLWRRPDAQCLQFLIVFFISYPRFTKELYFFSGK